MTRQCVAYATSRRRRCQGWAAEGFDTCLIHTSKHSLWALIQTLRAAR